MGHKDAIGSLEGVYLFHAILRGMLEENRKLRRETASLLEWNARLRAENRSIRAALPNRQFVTAGALDARA
jgi:regulator of replication initiation timing